MNSFHACPCLLGIKRLVNSSWYASSLYHFALTSSIWLLSECDTIWLTHFSDKYIFNLSPCLSHQKMFKLKIKTIRLIWLLISEMHIKNFKNWKCLELRHLHKIHSKSFDSSASCRLYFLSVYNQTFYLTLNKWITVTKTNRSI